jgi:O-antigen/teichoic acid export membrane protein
VIKEKLEKKYKALRITQYVTFILSIIACTIPLVVTCIRVVPEFKNGEERWSLFGVAAVITAIILIVVLRGLIRKFIDKLPYTVSVLIVSVLMLVLTICLKRIIDDAIAVLWVAAISSAAAFLLELTSMACKALAEHTKEEYGRIGNDV